MGVSSGAEYRRAGGSGSASDAMAGGGRVRNPNEPLLKVTHCLECNGEIKAGTPIGELTYVAAQRRWVHHDPSCQDLAWRAGGFRPASAVVATSEAAADPAPPPVSAPSSAAHRDPVADEPSPFATGPASAAGSEAGREVRPGDRLEFELSWPGERQFVVGRFRLSRELDPGKTREEEAEAMAEFVGAIVARATEAAEEKAGGHP